MAIPIWGDMFKRKPYYFPSRPSMSGLPSLGNMPGFTPAQTATAPFGGGIGKSAYQGAGLSTKKKGLSMNNMIKALSEMKKPPDMRPAPAGAYGERRPQLPAPPQFAALGGVNPSIMNTGGLPGARNKKWWEIMGYS